jgi:N6-adenosine-specific RNA methylase IME4
MSTEIISIDDALRALAEATTPVEFVRLANVAETLRHFAIRAGLGLAAQNRAAEIRLRAERGLGLLLAPVEMRGRPKNVRPANNFKLADFGVTRRVSHRAQALAMVPATVFEVYLRDALDRDDEITTRALLGVAERSTSADRNRLRIRGGAVSDLLSFAAAGHRVGTVLVDPPWQIEGASALLPYATVAVDDLKKLPVASFCAERCHCHLWCLPNETMFRAEEILTAWGFRVVTSFVWTKSGPLGRGNYWRHSHEILVTGVRGPNDRFDDRGLRSWIEAPRRAHSQKPEEVFSLLERASPEPRIELFSRVRRPGWFTWGHEIKGDLGLEDRDQPDGTDLGAGKLYKAEGVEPRSP